MSVALRSLWDGILREWSLVKPAAVILAGGGGARLGGVFKGLLTWCGEPFVVHLVRILDPVGPLALVTQSHQQQYLGPLEGRGLAVDFIHDPWSDQGPLAGLVAGLDWARERGCSGVVVAPCDSPCLEKSWLARVLASAAEAPEHIHICDVEGRLQPLHGWYPVAVTGDLRAAVAAGERRVGHWVSTQPLKVIPCSDLAGQFLNVNTPEDRALLRP